MDFDAPTMREFFVAYVNAALWATVDDATGEPLDRRYNLDDITLASRAQMEDDCRNFITSNRDDLSTLDAEQCGQDFWLTRNRHGTGFWDRGYPEELGARLSDAAHVWGEASLYAHEGAVYAV